MFYYDCDICEVEGDGYFGYNSTYGHCDNPACEREANRRLSADMREQVDTGRIDIAMELAGDEDPSLYL